MRTRTSIRGVMASILLAGIGLTALRSATDWWASVALTATLIGLSLAALFTVYRRGERRAFWSGFVAFGAGYLILAFGPWCETSIRPRLLTTKFFDALSPKMHPTAVARVKLWDAAGRPVDRVAFGRTPTEQSVATREHFQDIGHSLASLLLAGIGGVAARSFYANRDERKREAAEKAVGVMLKVLEAGL